MTSIIENPTHWQERAAEARIMADQMADADTKRTMLAIADGYERMARRAQARATASTPPRAK